MREWIRAQIFSGQSERLRAERLRAVGLGTLVFVGTALLILMVIEPSSASRRLVSLVGLTLIVGVVLLLSRRGYTTFASWIFVLGQVGLVTQRAWATGGVSSPVLPLYVVYVMMGGI
ncbi:MAG: hypothetical protein ABI852_15940, partial [Gemmatimonadaceae bacterium]